MLKKYEFLNIKKLKQGIQNIKKGYQEKGYFLTEVSYKVKKIKSSDKIQLEINIQEHEKTLIKKISFVGNYNISSKKIKTFLANKERNILSFLTNSSVYTEEKLKRDLQVIRFLYMEEGYLEMKMREPQVSLSPNKDGLYISFSISEGESFKVGQMDYAGDLIFSKVELRKGQELKADETFAYSKLQKDLTRIQTKYGDKGYAFANVIPQFHTQEGRIHILFQVQKGEPAHIRYINISDNHLTRDKVIRRLITLAEGDLYNASEILKSKNSIQRLGYFEEVDFFNKPVRGQDNKIDLEISLKEREEYGVFQIGGGYSSSSGFVVNGKLSKENLFGYGTTVGFQAALFTSRKEFMLDANYLDPYFLDTDWYFGVNVFSFATGGALWKIPNSIAHWFGRENNPQEDEDIAKQSIKEDSGSYDAKTLLQLSDREFSKNEFGGKVTLGRWLNDTTKVFSKFGFESVQFLAVSNEDIYSMKEAEGLRSSIGGVVEFDNRNDRFFPKNGVNTHASLEYIYQIRENLPSIYFTQGDVWLSYYIDFQTLFSFLPSYISDWTFLGELVLKNKIQYGRLDLLSQRGPIPFDKLYLLGGPLSLRGFQLYSVGKRKRVRQTGTSFQPQLEVEDEPLSQPSADSKPYGGRQQLFYNLELKFPLIPKAKLFGIAFFDIGYADDSLKDILLNLRKDVGVGILWVAPFGPISLKWGFPFRTIKEYGESSPEFHFNVGFDF